MTNALRKKRKAVEETSWQDFSAYRSPLTAYLFAFAETSFFDFAAAVLALNFSTRPAVSIVFAFPV